MASPSNKPERWPVSAGCRAAYLPDHASKSRLIIPGVKGFSEEDANWISGGATSFVHVPYLLRLSRRAEPLQGNLMEAMALAHRQPQLRQPSAVRPIPRHPDLRSCPGGLQPPDGERGRAPGRA